VGESAWPIRAAPATLPVLATAALVVADHGPRGRVPGHPRRRAPRERGRRGQDRPLGLRVGWEGEEARHQLLDRRVGTAAGARRSGRRMNGESIELVLLRCLDRREPPGPMNGKAGQVGPADLLEVKVLLLMPASASQPAARRADPGKLLGATGPTRVGSPRYRRRSRSGPWTAISWNVDGHTMVGLRPVEAGRQQSSRRSTGRHPRTVPDGPRGGGVAQLGSGRGRRPRRGWRRSSSVLPERRERCALVAAVGTAERGRTSWPGSPPEPDSSLVLSSRPPRVFDGQPR
jgi:hypothetical protein